MKRITLAFSLVVAGLVSAQTELFNEDFQNGISDDWTLIINDGNTPNENVSEYSSAWISVADSDDALDSIAASTSYFTPVGQADRWMISPAITLSAFGNVIKWQAKSQDPSYPDSYKVLISTTGTDISSFTDTIFIVGGENATWTEREVNISDLGFNGQEVHIAFVNYTVNGYKLFINDINLRGEEPLGVLEEEFVNVNVYPNPTTDLVTIEGITEFNSVSLININGAEMKISLNDKSIDLSKLEKGIYFLRILSNGNLIEKKIIKN